MSMKFIPSYMAKLGFTGVNLFSIFKLQEEVCILHGQVFVNKFNKTTKI